MNVSGFVETQTREQHYGMEHLAVERRVAQPRQGVTSAAGGSVPRHVGELLRRSLDGSARLEEHRRRVPVPLTSWLRGPGVLDVRRVRGWLCALSV